LLHVISASHIVVAGTLIELFQFILLLREIHNLRLKLHRSVSSPLVSRLGWLTTPRDPRDLRRRVVLLLLLEPTHLVHAVDHFRGIVSEEIILLRLIDYFYSGYVGLIAVVPRKINVVLHEEVHKAVLFLGR
jgi:hypothetical protein